MHLDHRTNITLQNKKRNISTRWLGAKMSKQKTTSDPVKAGNPTDTSYHDGLFQDPGEAKKILKAVRNFLLRTSGASPSDGNTALLGFAIEETEVEFSTQVRRVKMRTKYASGHLLLIAPITGDESEETLRGVEARLLAEFSTRIYEAQMRSSLQFYRTLNAEARETLVREYGGDEPRSSSGGES